MTKPLKPLSGNWVFNNRLNDWQIAPAPLNRQLPKLPKRMKDMRSSGSSICRPSTKVSPQEFIATLKAAFSSEWVSVGEASKRLKRGPSFIRDKFAECMRLKLVECKSIMIKPPGQVSRLTRHFRIRKTKP